MDSGLENDLHSGVSSASHPKHRRRVSVSDRLGGVICEVRSTFDKLSMLWDQVDMEEDLRLSRVSVALDHMGKLLSDMVDSETEMVKGVHSKIDQYSEVIRDYRAQMGMDKWMGCREKAGSLSMYKVVEAEMNTLKVQYEEKKRDQAELVEKLDRLALRIGEDINAILPETKELLPPAQIGLLVARANEMEHILNERVRQVTDWQHEVKDKLERMDMGTNTSNEEVLQILLNSDIADDEMALSESTIEAFKEVVDSINSRFESFVADLEFAYIEKMVRLTELWYLCCVPEQEQLFAREFNSKKHGRSDIRQIENEVDRLEKLYETRKNVYQKFNAWKGLWDEKLSLEAAENNPLKYTNRGGDLEKRLKRARALDTRLLPGAYQSLKTVYEEHIMNHPDDQIFIDGQTPVTAVEWTVKVYEQEKELQKANNHRIKKMNSGVITPIRGALSKARLTSTPTSIRGLLGPSPMCRLQNPLDTTQMSVIGPTHPPGSPGPKTSSPKRVGGVLPSSTPSKKFCVGSPMKKAFSTAAIHSPLKQNNWH